MGVGTYAKKTYGCRCQLQIWQVTCQIRLTTGHCRDRTVPLANTLVGIYQRHSSLWLLSPRRNLRHSPLASWFAVFRVTRTRRLLKMKKMARFFALVRSLLHTVPNPHSPFVSSVATAMVFVARTVPASPPLCCNIKAEDFPPPDEVRMFYVEDNKTLQTLRLHSTSSTSLKHSLRFASSRFLSANIFVTLPRAACLATQPAGSAAQWPPAERHGTYPFLTRDTAIDAAGRQAPLWRG